MYSFRNSFTQFLFKTELNFHTSRFKLALITIINRTLATFSRLYHINGEINMHIFSISGRLHHIKSETDMHIFSIFGSMYHINCPFFVYAFAPS